MSGSMTHWSPSSTVGRSVAAGVEGEPSKVKDCKGCGHFDKTTRAGMETQLKCIRNGCTINKAGGSNKKRKTKMQKKRKNRRTKKSSKR